MLFLQQQQQHQKSVKVKSCFKQRFLLLFLMQIDKKILQRLEQQNSFYKVFFFLDCVPPTEDK